VPGIDSDVEFVRNVRRTLGMQEDEAFLVPRLRDGGPPSDEREKLFWLFCISREIEQYNEAIAPWMERAELANARLVNEYRECLGVLPLEYDPRLVQAARRHSREMAELGYFSHTSPIPHNASPERRMANAGYRGGGGENIAWGSRTAESVFMQWFESPGHHANMVREGYTGIGVGQWNSLWTQKFGAGRRVMVQDNPSPPEVAGEVVPPQDAASAPAPRMGRPAMPGGRRRAQ
jgi:hypothetical protein